MAVAVERVPSRAQADHKPASVRGLVEGRRYRLIARHLDTTLLLRGLRVTRKDLDRLLDGRVRFLTNRQAEAIERLCSKRTAEWLRESRRYDALMSGELPTELIAPLIEEAFERYGVIPCEQMTGVPQRTFLRILTESSAISLRLADRIVTGIEGAGWWHETSERMGWYFGTEARLRDQTRNR